jgi:glycosyltransferase involved in cell wall biosynthesis
MTHEQWLREGFPPEVARQVEFLGVQNDAAVEDWFRRADLFVAPSRYESFGLVFVEAMRAAVPVIGTTAGGIPEVVTPGRSGLLVEPQRPGQIAEAILTLLRDEPRRLALARGARAEYESRFSNTIMATHTIEHHRALLERLPNRVRSR